MMDGERPSRDEGNTAALAARRILHAQMGAAFMATGALLIALSAYYARGTGGPRLMDEYGRTMVYAYVVMYYAVRVLMRFRRGWARSHFNPSTSNSWDKNAPWTYSGVDSRVPFLAFTVV